MANILGAILSGFKKKKDEEGVTPIPAAKPVPIPQATQPAQGGGIGGAIKSAWNNFWQPAPTVRVRDVVREVPGAAVKTLGDVGNFALDVGRGIVTRPVAQAILSASDAAGLRANLGKGEVMNTIEIPKNDLAGQLLFGDKPLKSYQQQTRDIESFLDTKTPLPKQAVAPVGIMLGTINAGLDLPGGGIVKSGGKEVVERVGKEGVEKAIEQIGKEGTEDVVETVVKNADELAPLIQELPREARGSVDATVNALKEQGFKIADDVLKKLKSGKVLEGDGYVLQSNPNGFITNFERKLTNLLTPPVQQVAEKEAAQSIGQAVKPVSTEVLQDASKGVDDVTKATEEIAQTSKRPNLDEALKQTDQSLPPRPDTTAPGGGTQTAQSAEDYITSRPVFENLTEEQKNILSENLKQSGFEAKLSEVKGAPLTRDEVIQEAIKIQDGLANPTTRQQTLDTAAKLQNTQNEIAQLSVKFSEAVKAGDTALASELDKQMTDALLKQRTFAADWGRMGNILQSPGQLNLPTGQRILSNMFGKVDEARIDDVLKAWQGMTPEQKLDPQAIRQFYFQFVEPTSKELYDEYRYINLLSSPLTHIRNITGNVLAGLVEEPATQLSRGVIDKVMTMLGRQPERTTFAREAVEYYQGVMKAFPKALKDAQAVLKGELMGTNAFEEGRIPIGKYAEKAAIFSQPGKTQGIRGLAGKATGAFLEQGSKINKGLEAADRFFKTLVEGGYSTAKTRTASRLGQELEGETLANIAQGAKAKSIDLTFQNELKPGSHAQGYLHQATDVVINGLMKARKAPGVIGAMFETVFPFLNIAANIFNRTVDYLPGVGALNMIGADSAAAREIAARQVTGGTAFLASLWAVGRLAQQDRIAGAAPADPDGRSAFLSAHPEYSVKLGDTWVQTGQLGVFGKLVETAIRYNEGRYHENDLTDSEAADMTQALLGTVVDMSDASYLDSLGNLIDSLKNFGKPEGSYAMKNLAATPIRQAIPLAGFQGWLAKLIDPVARKSESAEGGYLTNALAGVAKNLPILSYLYDPYLNPDNTPSTTSRWNAISPARLQAGNSLFENLWSLDRLERQMGSAENRFSEGKINLQDFVQSLQNASSYFKGVPSKPVDLGERGDIKVPTKAQIMQPLAQPKGVQLGGKPMIPGSQPIGSVKLSSKTKVSAPPKVGKISLSKLRLPGASKSGVSSKGIAMKLPKLSPPKIKSKKIGQSLIAEAESRSRSRRRSASA